MAMYDRGKKITGKLLMVAPLFMNCQAIAAQFIRLVLENGSGRGQLVRLTNIVRSLSERRFKGSS